MKTLTILAMTSALAFALPVMAEDTTPTGTASAQQQCRTERDGMGKATFAATYSTNKHRSNAFGKCVSRRSKATDAAGAEARANAAQQCNAEEAADPVAFKAKYGTGKKGANAHGKCVSQRAKAETAKKVDDEVAADVDAAKSCKAEQATDAAAFRAKYGTNENKSNAFGKCVSAQAKARADGPGDATS
jgi:hypothetical protein